MRPSQIKGLRSNEERLGELRSNREQLVKDAATARKQHRDTANAHLRVLIATLALLRTEVAIRKLRERRRETGPDLFEKAA